jgi:hypothetical protein
VKSNLVLAAWAACVAAILLLSNRPWNPYSMPRMDEVVVLPDDAEFADVRRYTEIGSGVMPYGPGDAVPAPGPRPALKFGWLHFESGLVRMPFMASSDVGWVTYMELPRGVQFGILSPTHIAMIEQRLGRPVTDEYVFPWHRKLWGWLVVIGLIGWTLLNRREARLAEDAKWAA